MGMTRTYATKTKLPMPFKKTLTYATYEFKTYFLLSRIERNDLFFVIDNNILFLGPIFREAELRSHNDNSHLTIGG